MVRGIEVLANLATVDPVPVEPNSKVPACIGYPHSLLLALRASTVVHPQLCLLALLVQMSKQEEMWSCPMAPVSMGMCELEAT